MKDARKRNFTLKETIEALVQNKGKFYMALGNKYRADQTPGEITETIIDLIERVRL